jgi:hypothetical protein
MNKGKITRMAGSMKHERGLTQQQQQPNFIRNSLHSAPFTD